MAQEWPMSEKRSAQLTWGEDERPYSTAFEDHYFSAGQGREETRFVFLESNDLPKRWKGRELCVIGELGFGTGLSFLETWALWQRHRQPGQKLIFQSVEGFPMRRDELARACAQWSDLAQLSEHLIECWEELQSGPVSIDEQTDLQVVFDDVSRAVPGFTHPVDTWFLDGFAPARNPQMWSAEVMQLIAKASADDARFASYTAAGWVRENLAKAGFVVEKRKGFGRKRHMVVGHLERSV